MNEYNRCLEREKDRIRSWCRTRQGAFEVYCVLHYDDVKEGSEFRMPRNSWTSDHGREAERIRSCGESEQDRERRRSAAIRKVRRKAPHLLPVLRLILKNGNNREESICELMKKVTRKK